MANDGLRTGRRLMLNGLIMALGPQAINWLFTALPSDFFSYESGFVWGFVLAIGYMVLIPVGTVFFVVGFLRWFKARRQE